MNIPSTCTTCKLPSDVTYKLQDAIHRPDSFSFDGAKELEITFRKILKRNTSEKNQQSFVCQQCNYEFCRTYGVLHRFSQTANVFQRLKSITTPKRKVTVMDTVDPILDQKDSSKVLMEEESAKNASNLQSNDELKLVDIKQEFDEINNIAEIPLAIKKEELFIDDTVTESTPVTVQPTTFVPIPTTHQGKIVCPECAESFSSFFKLTFHRRKHYSGKFTCHQCNAIFERYAQFRLHQISHADQSFDCSKCYAKFLRRSSLTCHLRHCAHIPKTGEIFVCHECSLKFANKAELKLHAAQRNFKCKICQWSFHNEVQLENHRQEVHSIKKHHRMGYKCNDCDMIIHEKQSLYQHRLTHSKKSDLPVESGRCYDIFAKKIALKFRKETHLKYYMCKQCGKRFPSLSTLNSHQLLHTEPKFACDQCDAKYYFQHSLREHRAVHTMIVEFPCNKCDKNLPDIESLKRHELESHPNKHYEEKALSWELSYDCDQPSSKLPDKCALETHEKNINSEKPFDCSKSDAKYPNPQMLKIHQQLHTIDKKEEYSLTANVSEFQRSEHGDENCRCNHCGVKFICRQNLLKHLKIVHRWDGDGTALYSDVTEDDEECEVVYIEIVSDEE